MKKKKLLPCDTWAWIALIHQKFILSLLRLTLLVTDKQFSLFVCVGLEAIHKRLRCRCQEVQVVVGTWNFAEIVHLITDQIVKKVFMVGSLNFTWCISLTSISHKHVSIKPVAALNGSDTNNYPFFKRKRKKHANYATFLSLLFQLGNR